MTRMTLPLLLGMLAPMLPAQLQPGHYLVGTWGWDAQWNPAPPLTSVQLVDPYWGSPPQRLKITGLQAHEIPLGLIVETPTSFLLGTALMASPGTSNVYCVQHVSGSTWRAQRLHRSPLSFLARGIATAGAKVFVIGRAPFGRFDDVEILAIDRATGAVQTWLRLGRNWRPNGATGTGQCLLVRGTTLHAFTFDTRDSSTSPIPPIANEHWRIDIKTKVATKLPDLPLSKRSALQGYGTSGAHWDPARKLIVVTGRFGEIVWRDEKGIDREYFGIPGKWKAQNSNCWRSAAVNEDTWALAFGDHEGQLDELRSRGAELLHGGGGKLPAPPNSHLCISTIVYIPGNCSYRPIRSGCPQSSGIVPGNYLGLPPGAPSGAFTLHLRTSAAMAGVLVGLHPHSVDLTAFGAPGCIVAVAGGTVLPAVPRAGYATLSHVLPPQLRHTTHVQWFVLDPGANALGVAVSDARRLELR